MPVKDLHGVPWPSAAERARIDAMLDRRGLPRPWRFRQRPDDDDAAPVTPPRGPRPSPLTGGAALEL